MVISPTPASPAAPTRSAILADEVEELVLAITALRRAGDRRFDRVLAGAAPSAREIDAMAATVTEAGRRMELPWAVAIGARSRGALLAACGQDRQADEALRQALAAHERLALPIGRARVLLHRSRVLQRLGRETAAIAHAREACETFVHHGASGWADEARAQLHALEGIGRGPERLTPAEERVARLAASGLRTREVAASLLVSPKTVEAHLGRAYRKLGIRNRAELGARMAPAVELRAGGR